jgi:xylulokinase
MTCVIGLDIGTTSTIGILIRLPATVLRTVSRPVTLHVPHPGWAEEDPAQWWQNVCEICRDLAGTDGIAPGEIAAIGVSGMVPAVVLLDAQGNVLRPSIQQSDGRCSAEVAAMKSEVDEAVFLARAGNGINQQLVGAKLRWIETNEPDVFARIATVFGSYDYINWRLTGNRAVEQNWALEAGFIDLANHEISADLVAFAHCKLAALPPKIGSAAIHGTITTQAATITGLPPGIPVIGGAADMIASALVAGITAPGTVLLKFGGAIDVLVATATFTPDPRMFLDYHLIPGLYMPNGCMSTGGSGLNWFASTFAGGERIAAAAQGLTLLQHLDQLAAQRPPGAEGLTILPYFLGEKTPIHDPAARGMLAGLTLSHDVGHVWRALLEAYAHAIAHHVEVLRDMGHATERFVVSDGGAESKLWMQIVADVLQQKLYRLHGHPGSCLGAAWAAAIGAGLASNWADIAHFTSFRDEILPHPAQAEIYLKAYRTFRELYKRTSGSTPLATKP